MNKNTIRLFLTIEFDGELKTPSEVMENVKDALVSQANTVGLAPVDDEIITKHIWVCDPNMEIKTVIHSF